MKDNLTLIPYKAWHVNEMDLIGRDKWIKPHAFTEFARRHEQNGVGYTVMNGKPVVCGGVDLWWDHVGEAWMIMSNKALLYPITITKVIKKHLPELMDKYDLHRVQATIRVTDAVSIRYIELLGFIREGTLHKFGPDGTDYFMYGRVR